MKFIVKAFFIGFILVIVRFHFFNYVLTSGDPYHLSTIILFLFFVTIAFLTFRFFRFLFKFICWLIGI